MANSHSLKFHSLLSFLCNSILCTKRTLIVLIYEGKQFEHLCILRLIVLIYEGKQFEPVSFVAAMEVVEEAHNQAKITDKRMKFEEIFEEGKEDRISELPDCLIIEILSRLPCTKEAIRTGTLSKRWEHLWTLLPILIFNRYDRNLAWSDFISFTDKALTQCRQLKLKKFKVHTCGYDTGSESQINNWIRYALRCNVEELNVSLLNGGCPSEFPVDQFFFHSSCFTDLSLSGFILNPTGLISWKNLRSLYISSGKLNEDLIEKILSGSPLLETLELDSCYGYTILNITSKSVKNLVFYGYNNHDDDDNLDDVIEINAPHISSLTIKGGLLLWNLYLVNVSSLVEAELDYRKMGHYETLCKKEEEDMLAWLILDLRHAKVLNIGIFCYKVLLRLEDRGFVLPSNVKFVDKCSESDLEESEDW